MVSRKENRRTDVSIQTFTELYISLLTQLIDCPPTVPQTLSVVSHDPHLTVMY